MSNITLNAGVGGATLGTDTVTGVDYQVVKIGFSAAGAAPVQVSAANALPVIQTGALPAGANVIGGVTQSGGPWTSNLTQLAGTAVATGNGVSGAGVLRVAIVSDQTSLTNAIPVSQSGTWNVTVSGTVTANLGTLNGVALDTSITGLQVAQGSATAAQKGSLTLAAVTTAAPAYTTAQSSPLSLTLTGGLRVDGSAVTQPVSGTVTTTPPANASTNLTQLAGTAVDVNSGNKSAGTLRVVLVTDQPSMTNAQPAAQSGTWTVQPGNTANTTPWLMTDVPATSGGWTMWSTPNNNANAPLVATVATVKGSAGQLGGYIVYNPNATVAYIQVFDVAGAVTLGTTRPNLVIPVPPTSGANIEFGKGIAFANAIKIAATTTDSGSTAPGTGLTVTVVYK